LALKSGALWGLEIQSGGLILGRKILAGHFLGLINSKRTSGFSMYVKQLYQFHLETQTFFVIQAVRMNFFRLHSGPMDFFGYGFSLIGYNNVASFAPLRL